MPDILELVADSIIKSAEPMDDMEKLYKLLLLYEIAWTQQGSILEIELLLKKLPVKTSGCLENLEFISETLLKIFDLTEYHFVKAAQKIFMIYVAENELWKLKRNVKLKAKGYRMQFLSIKNQVV